MTGWTDTVLSREAERDEHDNDYKSYQAPGVDLAGYPARHHDDRNTVARVRVFAVILDVSEKEEPIMEYQGIGYQDAGSVDERSLIYFCHFVDRYTSLSDDPTDTAAVCETQAEALRLTHQDVSLASVDLLLETLLSAITHLEEKRYEEQRKRETLEQKLWRNRIKRLGQIGIQRVMQRCRLKSPQGLLELEA
jgi:hypothetical protein